MKPYDKSMVGLTDWDEQKIADAVSKGWDLFLDKGIKGYDEDGNPVDVQPRLMTVYGLFVAHVKARNDDDYIDYR